MSQRRELRARIPRNLTAVDAFCLEFRTWHAWACSARDAFVSELLLREALANGVTHGGSIDGRIVCVVRGSEKRLLIAVHDGGPGFNWKDPRRSVEMACNCQTTGRGLIIYRQYANCVRFNRLGNCVVLVRFFRREQEKTK